MSDSSTGTQIVSWVSLGLGIVGLIIGAINHKKLTSKCGKRETVISLDIDNTSPKGAKPEVIEPEKKESAPI
jgi:hypothetical protein